MLRSRSYVSVPLLHPASIPTYLPQDRNTPFQLEYHPKLSRPNCPTIYNPKDAFASTHQLQEGDVVLFATDGVWDNVAASDVLRDITGWMRARDCWKEDGKITASSQHLAAATRDAFRTVHARLADYIVAMAKTRSFYGGNLDDITAVVTVVTKDSRNPSVPKTVAHR